MQIFEEEPRHEDEYAIDGSDQKDTAGESHARLS